MSESAYRSTMAILFLIMTILVKNTKKYRKRNIKIVLKRYIMLYYDGNSHNTVYFDERRN